MKRLKNVAKKRTNCSEICLKIYQIRSLSSKNEVFEISFFLWLQKMRIHDSEKYLHRIHFQNRILKKSEKIISIFFDFLQRIQNWPQNLCETYKWYKELQRIFTLDKSQVFAVSSTGQYYLVLVVFSIGTLYTSLNILMFFFFVVHSSPSIFMRFSRSTLWEFVLYCRHRVCTYTISIFGTSFWRDNFSLRFQFYANDSVFIVDRYGFDHCTHWCFLVVALFFGNGQFNWID